MINQIKAICRKRKYKQNKKIVENLKANYMYALGSTRTKKEINKKLRDLKFNPDYFTIRGGYCKYIGTIRHDCLVFSDKFLGIKIEIIFSIETLFHDNMSKQIISRSILHWLKYAEKKINEDIYSEYTNHREKIQLWSDPLSKRYI